MGKEGCINDETSPFLSLPEALQLLIVEKVDPYSLGKLSCSCQQLRALISLEKHFAVAQLWERHCRSLLDPSIIATHLAWGQIISKPAGYDASRVTSFWRCLWRDMLELKAVRWWPGGGMALLGSLHKQEVKDAAQETGAEPVMLSLSDSLARTGHTATSVGTWQVIVGGLSREGGPLMDVIILDLVNFTITRPVVRRGVADLPLGRFRHSAVPLPPLHGNPRLLLFGGYDMEGREFGMDECYTATISRDGSEVMWNTVKTSGQVPSPRFHHTANVYDKGRKLIVFGGEGSAVDDRLHWTGNESVSLENVEEDQITVAAYILDLQTMVWTKKTTRGEIPGVRSLHLTTVHGDSMTGRERLILVGGFKNAEQRLADMTPYALDLRTFEWEHPTLSPEDLPPPRHRSAISKVGNDKVMIVGGGTIIDGTPRLLDDCQALDLRSLTWNCSVAGPIARDGVPEEKLKSNPEVYDRATRAVSKTAGHTVESLLVFGGCIKGVLGVIPVEQVEMLLISTWQGSPEHHHPAPAPLAAGAAHEPTSATVGGSGAVFADHREPDRTVRNSKQALSVLKSEESSAAAFGPSHGGLVIPLSGEREETPNAPPSYAPAAGSARAWGATNLNLDRLPPEAQQKEKASRPVLDLNLPPPLSEEEEQDFLRDAAQAEAQVLYSSGHGGGLGVEFGEEREPGSPPLAQPNPRAWSLGGLNGESRTQGVPLGIAPSRPPPGLNLSLAEHGLRSHNWSTEAVLIRHGHEEGTSLQGPSDFPRFIELRYSMEQKGGGVAVGPSRESEPPGMLKRGIVDPPAEREGSGHASSKGLNFTGEYGPGNMLAKRTRLG